MNQINKGTKCPKCSGTTGYFEKLVVKYLQLYTWEHEPDGTSDDPEFISGGIRKFCQDCHADITKYIPKR